MLAVENADEIRRLGKSVSGVFRHDFLANFLSVYIPLTQRR